MRLRRRLALAIVLGACGPAAEPAAKIPTLEVEVSEAFVRRVTAEGYLKAVEATPLTAPEDSKRPMKIAWVALDGSEVEEGVIHYLHRYANIHYLYRYANIHSLSILICQYSFII